MSFSIYCSKSPQEVLTQLESTSSGLTAHEANSRIQKYGFNETTLKQVTWVNILARQFKSAFVYLLLVAAAIALVLGEPLDSFMIVLFVLIDIVLGFYQEYRSEQALMALKNYIVKKATVIRDNEKKLIDAKDIVPGDLVCVETGDIIPCDLRILTNENILIDESSLTGESIQIAKQDSVITYVVTEHYKAKNILFSGTTVVEGLAVGIAINTGLNTEFGKIAKLTIGTAEVSGFERQINKFSKFILILTLTTLALVFLTQLLFKDNLSVGELIVWSIALAVGVIPEAMPLVTTYSLSMGAAVLAKKHVVVKRLSAIEDLGGIQVLCTDKTGTITENNLTVSNVLSELPDKTLEYGLLASTIVGDSKTSNNSFDLAIHHKIGKTSTHSTSKYEKLFEIPFNPTRRRNSVLMKMHSHNELIVRGAVESVLPYIAGISTQRKNDIKDWISNEGLEGRRVIAIGCKQFTGVDYTISDEEAGLEFLGLISFVDPIKSTTVEAVKKAKRFGITVKIITGDSLEVAGAVAYTVGIIEERNLVITGEAFEKLKHAEQLLAIDKYNAFARVSPEQKYKIIDLLQKKYEVGYLGEGINDAPALKVAGVAIVVDNASDVAREVADIVLLKNNLKVIVDGIEEGRKTFINVTNYIKATLTSNFGNFYAMAFASLVIDYLPMLPIQILLVNLLSDFPMISIASDNVEHSEIKNPHSYDVREIILISTLLGLVSTVFDFMMFSIFNIQGESQLQTNWFMGSILTELVLIYSIRSKKSVFKAQTRPSNMILVLTGVAAFFTVFIPFTNIGHNLFGFVTPTSRTLYLLVILVIGYLATTEFVKNMYYKHFSVAAKS